MMGDRGDPTVGGDPKGPKGQMGLQHNSRNLGQI